MVDPFDETGAVNDAVIALLVTLVIFTTGAVGDVAESV